METDPRIMQLARLLVEKHGDDALAEVTKRILWRLGVKDYSLVIVWASVAEEIHRIRPNAKPTRPQASLDDLMDDPVMHAMVHDDDDRRQEVYDTLTTVKHRLRRYDS